MVWSKSEETGEVELKPAAGDAFSRTSDQLIELVIENTDTIYTTPEHPFYVHNRWIQAIDLMIGDTLTSRDSTMLKVSAHTLLDTTVTVYNFEVSDYHTYFVSEEAILVHNACDIPIGLDGKPQQMPDVIIRGGGSSPSNLKARPKDNGKLSWSEGLANPIEGPTVFTPKHKEAVMVDPKKLPKGSVILDGGIDGHARGHISTTATVEELKRAVIGKIKIPKQ